MKNLLRVAMSEKDQRNIVLINAYDGSNSPQAKSNDFFVSYLKYKNLTIGQIEISLDTNEIETARIIGARAYENFNLNSHDKYKIFYLETDRSDRSRIFTVFIAQNETINKIFAEIISKNRYIDYVVAAPLLFKALYKTKILPLNRIDAFLFLQSDDAFIAVYKNGEYLQSRSIRYNLNLIKDKYVSLTGLELTVKDFSRVLLEENNKKLEDIFTETAYYIGDALNSVTRLYDFKPDNIFILSESGATSLSRSIQKHLDIKTENLTLATVKNESCINALMRICAKSYMELGEDKFNFSVFTRPPAFFKRPGGKLILSGIAATFLTLVFPLYQVLNAYVTKKENDVIEIKLEKIISENDAANSKLQALKERENELKNLLEAEVNQSFKNKKILSDMSEEKTDYVMKAEALRTLANKASERNIKILSLLNTDKNVTLNLKSDDEKAITEFLIDIDSKDGSAFAQNIYFRGGGFESNATVRIR